MNRQMWRIIAITLFLLFLLIAGLLTYVWYIKNYLPSNYGVKTIGVVYKRAAGRKSANDIYLYYKVKGQPYYVIGQVNSLEDYIGREVRIGEKLYLLYYPDTPAWSKIDFKSGIVPDTVVQTGAKKAVTNLIEISLEVEDEDSGALLSDFLTSVKSTSLNEVYKPDSIGHILFALPSKEDMYTIKISRNNYVSKIIQVNTNGVRKKTLTDFFLPAKIGLVKKKKGVDYSAFDEPVAKAALLNDTTIDWDYKYSEKMKEKYTKSVSK